MRMNLKKAIRSGLYRAEARYGYFLPHHISSSRDDEFYKTIYELALGESVKTALILGSDWRRRSTQALIAGFRDREAQSGVVYLGMTGQVPGSRGEGRKGGLVRWYGTLSPGTGGMRDQLRRAIVEIRQDSDIEQFDVVLIDGCLSIQGDNTDEALLETLLAAKYVLLDDVSNSNIHEIYRYLQREQRHEVIGENPDLRNGYAVFARRQPNVLTRAQLAAG